MRKQRDAAVPVVRFQLQELCHLLGRRRLSLEDGRISKGRLGGGPPVFFIQGRPRPLHRWRGTGQWSHWVADVGSLSRATKARATDGHMRHKRLGYGRQRRVLHLQVSGIIAQKVSKQKQGGDQDSHSENEDA